MCKEGDICPTPILKLQEVTFDENETVEHNETLLDRSLIRDAAK